MSSNLETVALMAIVGGLVCGAGAWFSKNYTESIYVPLLGTITRNPYQQYVFPLSFFAVLLLVMGLVVGISAIARPKRIVLKPVSTIPVELFEPCPHCGFRIPPGSKYCSSCGKAMKQNENGQGSDKST